MFRFVPRLVAGQWVVIDRRTGRVIPCEDRATAEGVAAALNLGEAVAGGATSGGRPGG